PARGRTIFPYTTLFRSGAAQPVSRAHVLRAGAAAQPFDLLEGYQPPVRAVALRADPSLAIPAPQGVDADPELPRGAGIARDGSRSEEHTSELQSRSDLV